MTHDFSGLSRQWFLNPTIASSHRLYFNFTSQPLKVNQYDLSVRLKRVYFIRLVFEGA